MSRPENMTPDEAEIWQRMELHEAAVNMLCDKLADARALAASWMNDHGEP